MDILPELTEAGDQHEASSPSLSLSKWLYISHNHLYVSSSGMADATLFYCYLCRDGCVTCISILHCGSCLYILSAIIPCMWTVLASKTLKSTCNVRLFWSENEQGLQGITSSTLACIYMCVCVYVYGWGNSLLITAPIHIDWTRDGGWVDWENTTAGAAGHVWPPLWLHCR